MLIAELLQNYVNYIFDQMVTIGDSIFGPRGNHSAAQIPFPQSFQGQTYVKVKGDKCADWGSYGVMPIYFLNGQFYIAYTATVRYLNGTVSVDDLSKLGRVRANTWANMSAENANFAENVCTEFIEAHKSDLVIHTDSDVNYTTTVNPNAVYITFGQTSGNTIIQTFPKYDGTDLTASGIQVLYYLNYPCFVKNGEYYEEQYVTVSELPPAHWDSNMNNGVMITNTNDQTFIDSVINNSGSTNNYTSTYVSENGDTITTYYGDNYIITKSDPGAETSYNEYYNKMVEVVNQINTDTGSDITVPEYTDIKPDEDPDDDIEVEMDLNDAAFGTGLSHYYVTTVDAPVLSDISEAMSAWDINNTGKDLYRNLLSCRITKVGPIPAENSTFVIYGEELLHNGSPISINKITGNPSMDLGEYEILPKFNDFRDYAPYTKIEMFIPYCGWVALPSHVMSSEDKPKIITGTLLCDIIAGTCKAVIKCNDTVIAEASGFTAVDVPFTGENVGMKMAGIASAITSYGSNAAKTVGSVASGGMSAGGAGAGAAAAGGLVGLLGSYAQMYSAFNANYTEICGKTGDGCNVAGLNKVYIKIQRPKTGGYEAPDFVPEDYGHTTGFIAMKKALISDCEGLIVCSNPDTSGIGGATDRERQAIKNLLESGIIVRHTEPEP